jgi:DNA mismatch repair protein MutS2
LIREWKESKETVKDELSKSIRKQIKSTREDISKDIRSSQTKNNLNNTIKLIEGDDVILKETGQMGIIIRIKKEKALVLFGNIKTETELNKLQKTEKQIQKSSGKSFSTNLYSIKKEPFFPVLDVRGYRRDEALHEVENYLDKAILHDFSQLKIIHGFGDGILKQAIRSILKKYSFIKDFHSEHADYGGDGVTIIEL